MQRVLFEGSVFPNWTFGIKDRRWHHSMIRIIESNSVVQHSFHGPEKLETKAPWLTVHFPIECELTQIARCAATRFSQIWDSNAAHLWKRNQLLTKIAEKAAAFGTMFSGHCLAIRQRSRIRKFKTLCFEFEILIEFPAQLQLKLVHFKVNKFNVTLSPERPQR